MLFLPLLPFLPFLTFPLCVCLHLSVCVCLSVSLFLCKMSVRGEYMPMKLMK
jgi:hypothetical protein